MRKLAVQGAYALYVLRQRDLDSLAQRTHPYKVGDVLLFNAEETQPLIGAEFARAANESDALLYLQLLSESRAAGGAADGAAGGALDGVAGGAIGGPAGGAVGGAVDGAAGGAIGGAAGGTISGAESAVLNEIGRKLFEQQSELVRRLRTENTELLAIIEDKSAELTELHASLNQSGMELLITDEERNLTALSLEELSSEMEVLKESLFAVEGRNLSLEAELTLAYAEREYERECGSILAAAGIDTGTAPAGTAAAGAGVGCVVGAEPAASIAAEADDSSTPAKNAYSEIATSLPSGGVVVINHEFAALPRKSWASLAFTRLKSAAKLVFLFLVIGYVFLTVSLFQTMEASGVPVQEYLDAVVSALRSLVGLS